MALVWVLRHFRGLKRVLTVLDICSPLCERWAWEWRWMVIEGCVCLGDPRMFWVLPTVSHFLRCTHWRQQTSAVARKQMEVWNLKSQCGRVVYLVSHCDHSYFSSKASTFCPMEMFRERIFTRQLLWHHPHNILTAGNSTLSCFKSLLSHLVLSGTAEMVVWHTGQIFPNENLAGLKLLTR